MSDSEILAWIRNVTAHNTNNATVRIAVMLSGYFSRGQHKIPVIEMARSCRLHRKTFQRAITELEFRGLLRIERPRWNMVAHYTPVIIQTDEKRAA